MNVTFRPIDTWPGELTPASRRQPSPFKLGLPESEKLLRYEVGRLGGALLVVQLAIREMDLKVDGRPKIRAEYEHPGVIVSFESRYGPLRYATDAFDSWPANLRAVALGLEALRKVDRYGISKRGEQYTGWRALESGGGGISTKQQAERFILNKLGVPGDFPLTNPDHVRTAYRRLAKTMHPDAGGDPEQFKKLQRARDLLLGEAKER